MLLIRHHNKSRYLVLSKIRIINYINLQCYFYSQNMALINYSMLLYIVAKL